jgi:hypothetical protein
MIAELRRGLRPAGWCRDRLSPRSSGFDGTDRTAGASNTVNSKQVASARAHYPDETGVTVTEELKVEPDQLDTFASKLKQLATEHTQATPYVQQWLKVDDGAGGVFLTGVVDTLSQILTDLESNFATLTSVTEGSAAELVKSAQMYRSTDHTTAAALDKTYVGRSR